MLCLSPPPSFKVVVESHPPGPERKKVRTISDPRRVPRRVKNSCKKDAHLLIAVWRYPLPCRELPSSSPPANPSLSSYQMYVQHRSSPLLDKASHPFNQPNPIHTSSHANPPSTDRQTAQRRGGGNTTFDRPFQADWCGKPPLPTLLYAERKTRVYEIEIDPI